MVKSVRKKKLAEMDVDSGRIFYNMQTKGNMNIIKII